MARATERTGSAKRVEETTHNVCRRTWFIFHILTCKLIFVVLSKKDYYSKDFFA